MRASEQRLRPYSDPLRVPLPVGMSVASRKRMNNNPRKCVFGLALLFICLLRLASGIEPEPDWKSQGRRYLEEELANVQAPQTGTRVTLEPRVGRDVSGVLVDITWDAITISNRSGLATYQRKDLTPNSAEAFFFREGAKARALERVTREKADYDRRRSEEDLVRRQEIAKALAEQARAAEQARIAEQARVEQEERARKNREEIVSFLLGIALVVAGTAIYFLPSLVASKRDHHNVNAIIILNLFLGWTFLGWVVSLVWAMTKVQKKE